MTETGITHTPREGKSRPGTVGDAVPSVEVRISEAGEVLIRSRMNMAGYFKNPEGTKAAFTDEGFFRTGDLGEVDSDGWLKIVGRAKEQFKTTKGKYVSPNAIEKLLCVHPAVEGCCVMGQGMPYPFAVVVPSEEWRLALSRGDAKEALGAALTKLLSEVNAQLEGYERLKFIVVTDQPWTVGNGILTPTLKVKRGVLERTYTGWFDAWNQDGGSIVWHLMTREQRTGQQAGS